MVDETQVGLRAQSARCERGRMRAFRKSFERFYSAIPTVHPDHELHTEESVVGGIEVSENKTVTRDSHSHRHCGTCKVTVTSVGPSQASHTSPPLHRIWWSPGL